MFSNIVRRLRIANNVMFFSAVIFHNWCPNICYFQNTSNVRCSIWCIWNDLFEFNIQCWIFGFNPPCTFMFVFHCWIFTYKLFLICKFNFIKYFANNIHQCDLQNVINVIMREFECKYDCMKALSMSDKTLTKALTKGIQYNGHIFKEAGSKLKIGEPPGGQSPPHPSFGV